MKLRFERSLPITALINAWRTYKVLFSETSLLFRILEKLFSSLRLESALLLWTIIIKRGCLLWDFELSVQYPRRCVELCKVEWSCERKLNGSVTKPSNVALGVLFSC